MIEALSTWHVISAIYNGPSRYHLDFIPGIICGAVHNQINGDFSCALKRLIDKILTMAISEMSAFD